MRDAGYCIDHEDLRWRAGGRDHPRRHLRNERREIGSRTLTLGNKGSPARANEYGDTRQPDPLSIRQPEWAAGPLRWPGKSHWGTGGAAVAAVRARPPARCSAGDRAGCGHTSASCGATAIGRPLQALLTIVPLAARHGRSRRLGHACSGGGREGGQGRRSRCTVTNMICLELRSTDLYWSLD
ncbi:hypothetical protein BN6_21580 [Saccharothrix espanaensis DSM 44229]|uniref:Uncharacterized protein n=1 Tax=Saccharothrix espanaensis (strain ATCC 51144 / DSM 44229 / JCM 9112 / NBRC 15066 / NRRL 15764) TaxID=1179773 RepID=K0JQ94_SACES|nr:hypothetical protein BN6_21580 [Saccharothrix espanaensis DSM 44229]